MDRPQVDWWLFKLNKTGASGTTGLSVLSRLNPGEPTASSWCGLTCEGHSSSGIRFESGPDDLLLSFWWLQPKHIQSLSTHTHMEINVWLQTLYTHTREQTHRCDVIDCSRGLSLMCLFPGGEHNRMNDGVPFLYAEIPSSEKGFWVWTAAICPYVLPYTPYTRCTPHKF